jgi:signal peptidase I
MSDETVLSNENQNPPEEKGSFRLDLYYWTQALVMVLICLILACTLAGRVIGVVGSSMVPTLHDGDLLLLQSLGYTPRQGDVVVLRKPGFPPPPQDTAPIVKRVIAVGGQHVRVDYEANAVYVDGVALEDDYILEPMMDRYNPEMNVLDVTVPEGSIYVMGDNRNNSSDSRHEALATVDSRYVLGRVLCVMLPFQDFGAVE